MSLYTDAREIWEAAIAASLPDQAVKRALADFTPGPGRLVLAAVGKAAWRMARTALDCLGDRVDGGVVITKHGHLAGPLPGLVCREAGHPVPDGDTFAAADVLLRATGDLREGDTVVLLLSGGGSALFEKPLCSPGELLDITGQLLSRGADITEINAVRKRLSAVKGGRFALHCAPARVFSVILSDVLGDRADTIASGPACPDASTCAQALAAAEKYRLALSPQARALLERETPKALDNAAWVVAGGVGGLCRAALDRCRALGYRASLLTDALACEAREAGEMLGALAREHADTAEPLAFVAGGETVVRLTGSGLGGRNQEVALSAAPALAGLAGAAVFSVGSDGTDGPTDAAGGYVDGGTAGRLAALGLDTAAVLADNDAYHALDRVGGLIRTGPTGTNVNDLSVLLLRPPVR